MLANVFNITPDCATRLYTLTQYLKLFKLVRDYIKDSRD